MFFLNADGDASKKIVKPEKNSFLELHMLMKINMSDRI